MIKQKREDRGGDDCEEHGDVQPQETAGCAKEEEETASQVLRMLVIDWTRVFNV